MSEKPECRVVKSFDDVEIREYEPYLAIQATFEGTRDEATETGFDVLAGYIFGNNQSKEKIGMTTPVTQESANAASAALTQSTEHEHGPYAMQFMLPSKYTRDTLPKPTDARIEVVEVPGRTIAALSYRGRWTTELYEEKLAALRAALARQGLTARPQPIWARYNSPMMPFFLRHNEIWLELERPT